MTSILSLKQINDSVLKLVNIVHPSWKWSHKKKIENKNPEEPVTRKTIFDVVVGMKDALTAVSSMLEKTKGQKCPRIAGLEAKVMDLESDLD